MVRTLGGQHVATLLPGTPSFENADFLFKSAGVVVELKELQTELTNSDAYKKSFHALLERVMTEDPAWRPVLFGGNGKMPSWFITNTLGSLGLQSLEF